MEGSAAVEKTALVSYEEAFKEELIHFHDCVTAGRQPRTGGEDGKRDVELLREITLRWKRATQPPTHARGQVDADVGTSHRSS
jgi:hypothetical protein